MPFRNRRLMTTLSIDTPIGPLTAVEEGGAIVRVFWGAVAAREDSPLLAEARRQLRDYFSRRRKTFDLPVAPRGTDFQRALWKEMACIPYGECVTYGDLASRIGSGARAVGGACGRNPIAVILPCHRVVGADGSLTGYSGGDGLATKRALLDLERGSQS